MARQKENQGLELLEMSGGRGGRGEKGRERQLPAKGGVLGSYRDGGSVSAYSKPAGPARVFRIVRPDGSVVYTDIPDGPGRVQQVAGHKEQPGSLRYTEIRRVSQPEPARQTVQQPTIAEPELPVHYSTVDTSRLPAVEHRPVPPQAQQQAEYDDLFSEAALHELLGHMGSSAAQRSGGGFAQMLGDAIAPDPSAPINQYQDEKGFLGQLKNHRQIIGRGFGQYGENLYQDGMDVTKQTQANLPGWKRKIMDAGKVAVAAPFSGGDPGAAAARYGEARYEQKLTPGEAFNAAGEEALANAILGRIGGRFLKPAFKGAGDGVARTLSEGLSRDAFKEWVKQNLPRETHAPEASPRQITKGPVDFPQDNLPYWVPKER